MIKSVLFTKNPDVMGTLNEVAEWAEENNCYYTCLIDDEENNWDAGTVLLTTKGNELVILETTIRSNAYPEAKVTSITKVVEVSTL